MHLRGLFLHRDRNTVPYTRATSAHRHSSTHSKTRDDNSSDDQNQQEEGIFAKHRGPDGYRCPYKYCEYIVKKAAILRRHYGQHLILAEEACVCCSFKARAVSDYLSHVSQHEEINSNAKRMYINLRSQELRELVRAELGRAPPKDACLRDNATTKKRKRNVQVIGSLRSHVDSQVDNTTTNTLDSSLEQIQNVPSLPLLTPDVASLQTALPDANFDVLFPNSAPVFGIANYPVHSWGLEHGG